MNAEVELSQTNAINVNNRHFNIHLTCRLVRAGYRRNVEFIYFDELRVLISKAIEFQLHTNLKAFKQLTSLLTLLQLEHEMQTITLKSRIEFVEFSSTPTPSMHR